MKRILYILSAVLAFAGCQQKYEFNTDFEMPTSIDGPGSVSLDVTSGNTVVLSWAGGGAADGGIVLYDVLFDKEGGDFSSPIDIVPSDNGALKQLTLSHSALNILARKAGIRPNQSGKLIWKVRGARAGEIRMMDSFGTINVTRGDGIDNMPENLYIAGAAAREAGQLFRVAEEGVYVIVTRLGAGSLNFTSEKGGGNAYYADSNLKLQEGDGSYTVSAAPSTGLARITVDFNTLGVKIEEMGTQIFARWAATGADYAVLDYVGDGVFEGTGEAVFYGPGRDGTPSWCSWVEERYAFTVNIDGQDKRWGSSQGGNAITPDGSEAFYYIYEFALTDWDDLWKMDHALDLSMVKVTIWTNKDNHITHYVERAGAIVYEQPTSAPEELYLYGGGAEVEGQPFRKASDGVFVIYSKLQGGNISFRSSTESDAIKYFADAEDGLYIGARSKEVEASEGVSRITVDFNTKKVSIDAIGTDVRLIWGCNYDTVVSLTYQSQGRFAGEGRVVFVQSDRPESNPPSWLSWTEERYYFIANVNGEEVCWGRLDGVDAENRPDGDVADNFFDIGEFAWSQWDHLWKMASVLDNSNVAVTINTNDNGRMNHSFTRMTEEPVPPTIAADKLSLRGSGAEVASQSFLKKADGVFVVYAKLKDGKVSFTDGSKNYFADAEGNLFQGDGETDVTASTGDATAITVNFTNNTVSFASVDKVRIIFGATFGDVVKLSYAGEGVWSGKGVINFIDPAKPETNPPSWLSWVEERYYFIPTINGEESLCWGRLDGVTAEKPDGSENFFDMAEFGWSQWDHLWKFADEFNGAETQITLYTNKNGVMTHTVSK